MRDVYVVLAILTFCAVFVIGGALAGFISLAILLSR
jgi:hypothetical protein